MQLLTRTNASHPEANQSLHGFINSHQCSWGSLLHSLPVSPPPPNLAMSVVWKSSEDMTVGGTAILPMGQCTKAAHQSALKNSISLFDLCEGHAERAAQWKSHRDLCSFISSSVTHSTEWSPDWNGSRSLWHWPAFKVTFWRSKSYQLSEQPTHICTFGSLSVL